ncbi:hypothetical protein [Candidatus Ferrigenium straubiae]|jgi:hypothetical protein|uniref:hypothetical protein n=1 Tax=Candidatus Ferrigenium straubiae TaxID=2919506 RepID=UPI003F4ACA8B
MQSQLIRVKTITGAPIYISLCADEDQKIFVLMNITAFTVGTYFESAEKALKECIDVINKVLEYRSKGDKIEALHSDHGGAFLSNEEMASILSQPPAETSRKH